MKYLIILFFSFGYNALYDDGSESIERGKKLYLLDCSSCHMQNGQGIPTLYPPLAQSDYFEKGLKAKVDVILNGAKGEMVVNGVTYNSPMEGVKYTDEQLADILNYIGNNWGNKADIITPKEIKKKK